MKRNNFSAQGGSASGGKILLLFIAAIILTLGLSVSFQSLLAAWTAPLANPPTCLTGNPGCDEPINKGSTAQIKGGPLYVNANNSAGTGFVAYGNVGVGTASPASIGDGGSPVILQVHKSSLSGTHGSIIELTHAQTGTAYTAGGLIFGTTATAGSDKRYSAIYGGPDADSATNPYGYLNFAVWNNGVYNSAMYIKSNGNVGIGTVSPGVKLQVIGGSHVATSIKTDGYIEDVSGIGNLVPSHSWTIGSGGVGIFNQNGATSENSREWGIGPHGNRAILWKGGNDAVSDADGGWNSNAFLIDKSKTYRYTVWIKRTGGTNGTFYFGASGSELTHLDGTTYQTNPYFYCGGLPELDKWYLAVGYIHAYDDSSASHYGGLYDGVTGQKVISFNGGGNCGTDYKFTGNSSVQVHRTYLYYSTDINVRQYWWDSRVEEVNGKEPSIAALLGVNSSATGGGWTDDGTVVRLTTASDNVGIGTTGPGAKLEVAGENARILLRGGTYNSLMFQDGGSGDPGYITWYYNGASVAQVGAGATFFNTGNVGIGVAVPGQKLDVAGNIKAFGAFMGQRGTNITHLPWYNIGASFTGYLKLVTPIVHNESNMFVIKITGYEYGQSGKVSDIKCGGYAYSGNTLISKYCHTDGTNLPVEIGTEDRGGTTYVVIRLGTPTWSAWYYSHFTAEYTGWQAKDPAGFTWVEGEITPAQTGNTNNVDVNDQAGTITTTGIVYTDSSFRYTGSANTIMDSNQFYCKNDSNCHFNYSGSGGTYVGNAAGTWLYGTAYANGGTICASNNNCGYLTSIVSHTQDWSTITGPKYFTGSAGGTGWLAGIGTGAAASNGNSISVDTIETMRQSSGVIDGTLEVFNYYPGQTMRINGSLVTTGTSYQRGGYTVCDSSNNCGYLTSGSSQWTTSGSNIYYNTGNVGIGVAAPGTKLEVIDSATNVARIIRNSANTSGLQRVLAIKGSSTGSSVDGFGPVIEYELLDNSGTTYTLAYSGAVRSGADNNGSMVFWTMNNGTLSEKMRITNTGNVGIKETNPTNSLAVSGVIRAAGNAGDYGGWGTGGWAVELGRDATYGYVGSYDRSASIYKPLYLFASKILLNGGGEGDVGIGTTNPGAKLDVMSSNSRARLARTVNNGGPGDDTFYGGYFEGPSSQMSTQNSYGVYSKVISGASTENNIAVIGEADGNNAVNGSRTALYGWAHGITGTNYGLLIYSYGAPTNYGVYSYADRNYFSGKVGIGVTDAGSYKLYVNGNAYTTGTWGGSDARWKKNILPLEDSLSEIIRLQGVNYEWKTEEYPNQGFTEGPQIGLIAQDVEKVIPELVRTGEDGYKSVSYEKLTAVLVEAIKTQQKQIKDEQTEKDAEIKTLRKEIEISQKENRELQARLDRIEAELLK